MENLEKKQPASGQSEDLKFEQHVEELREKGQKRRLFSNAGITLILALTALIIFFGFYLWSDIF